MEPFEHPLGGVFLRVLVDNPSMRASLSSSAPLILTDPNDKWIAPDCRLRLADGLVHSDGSANRRLTRNLRSLVQR
jgi:hypothetical protein